MSEIYEMSEYFRKLNDTLEQHQRNAAKNPPREVQLLRAMKAFMPEEKHPGVDRVIDMMILSQTFESMRRETQSSIHPDGVYDIDSNCTAGRNGMNGLMLAALAVMAQPGPPVGAVGR